MRTDYPFFMNFESGFEREKETFASIFDEVGFLYGAEITYINTTLAQLDPGFGEYLGKMITEGTQMRLFFTEIEEDFYNQDSSIYSKFGFVPEIGEATVWGTFSYFSQNKIIPKVQDIIYYPKTRKMFEVSHVNKWHNFYYKLDLIHYTYDHSKVSPSVTDPNIQSLTKLDDLGKKLINDALESNEDAQNIVPDADNNDGLYD